MATRISELSWSDLKEKVGTSSVAIVPVGAIEPHGLHGPLGFDNYIADAIAVRLAEACDGILAPGVPYGCCKLRYDITGWPGSISLSPDTLINFYTDIGKELARQGFKKIIFVNGHDPNTSLLEIAAFAVWADSKAAMGILEWWLAAPEEIKRFKGVTHGTHADEVETSILLATEGGTFVQLDKANRKREKPEVSPEEFNMYVRKVRFTRKLDERWVGPECHFGSPHRAEAEVGREIIEKTIAVGMELIKALDHQLTDRSSS